LANEAIVAAPLNRMIDSIEANIRASTLAPIEFNRDSPDGSTQSPTMLAEWASDRESGPELSR
jgi:hypothetical protein